MSLYFLLGEPFVRRALVILAGLLVLSWFAWSRGRKRRQQVAHVGLVRAAYQRDPVEAARVHGEPSFGAWLKSNPKYELYLEGDSEGSTPTATPELAATADEAPREVQSELNVLFLGDTGPVESYGAEIQENGATRLVKDRGYDACFERLDAVLSGADFVIANLETTLTDISESPIQGRQTPIHRDDLVDAPRLLARHGIDAVSLGNDHSFDYGDLGLAQTMHALRRAQVVPFGAGENAAIASTALKRSFRFPGSSFDLVVAAGKHKGREDDSPYYASDAGSGVNGWTAARATQEIRSLRTNEPEAFLVAFPHWGQEYRWRDEGQAEVARALIDGGADLVLGHGAHMVQEIEQYRGRWIVYGLGNFMLNAPGGFEGESGALPYSLIARLNVVEGPGRHTLALRLYPIVSDNQVTGYQPRPTTAKEFEDVRERLLQHPESAEVLSNEIETGEDETGRYLSLPIWARVT